MATKKQVIEYINNTNGIILNSANTSFSNINKSKEVWWFNIAISRFFGEVNLLLNTTNKVIWLQLPKGFVKSIVATFKIRQDKNAVDLEISADKSFKYLIDVKSGGTNFNFSKYVKEEIIF